MEITNIDFKTTYKILKQLTDKYRDNDLEIDADLVEDFLIIEAQIAVYLGNDKFKVVNIDYDLVDYKLCRRVAGYLQDFEDSLPYNLRRLAEYWLNKYISVRVKDEWVKNIDW